MANITYLNGTGKNATAQKAQETVTKTATATGSDTGGITNLPVIREFLQLDPTIQAIFLVGVIAVGSYYIYENYIRKIERLDKTTYKERLKNTITIPLDDHGSRQRQYLYNQATGNKNRLVGMIVKTEQEKHVVENDDGETSKREMNKYSVLKGGNRPKLYIKYFWYTVLEKINIRFLKYRISDTYVIPNNGIKTGGKGVYILKDVSLIYDDGIYYVSEWETELFLESKTIFTEFNDSVEARQQLPEIYSQLNTRIAGQLNVMDRKTKNFIEYDEQKGRRERYEGSD